MHIYDRECSVLKASKKYADKFSAQLLASKLPNGKPVFKREELPNGFEIQAKRMIEGKLQPCAVFRYTNDDGLQLIEWDSYAITIE